MKTVNLNFRRYHEAKTKVTWSCTIKKCITTVYTLNGDYENTVLQSNVQHTHDDTVLDLQAHLLCEACKKNTFLTSKPEAVINYIYIKRIYNCNAFTRFIKFSMALTVLKTSNFAALSDVLFGVIGIVLAFSDFSAWSYTYRIILKKII